MELSWLTDLLVVLVGIYAQNLTVQCSSTGPTAVYHSIHFAADSLVNCSVQADKLNRVQQGIPRSFSSAPCSDIFRLRCRIWRIRICRLTDFAQVVASQELWQNLSVRLMTTWSETRILRRRFVSYYLLCGSISPTANLVN